LEVTADALGDGGGSDALVGFWCLNDASVDVARDVQAVVLFVVPLEAEDFSGSHAGDSCEADDEPNRNWSGWQLVVHRN
jgi:hypothetical protein